MEITIQNAFLLAMKLLWVPCQPSYMNIGNHLENICKNSAFYLLRNPHIAFWICFVVFFIFLFFTLFSLILLIAVFGLFMAIVLCEGILVLTVIALTFLLAYFSLGMIVIIKGK